MKVLGEVSKELETQTGYRFPVLSFYQAWGDRPDQAHFPLRIVQTTGWSYGTGSSIPSVIRTFSSLKYGHVTSRETVVNSPATWLRGC